MKTAAAAPASKKPGFLINRNFALLWGGQSISNVGDYVFSTTLILWIAAIIARGQTWAPVAVSGVTFASAEASEPVAAAAEGAEQPAEKG